LAAVGATEGTEARGDRRCDVAPFDDDGSNVSAIEGATIRPCSAIDGAKIVDAILNQALEVIERRRIRGRRREPKADRGGRGRVGTRAVHWETKLIELVSVVIDASASTGGGAEGARGWLQYPRPR